MRKPFGSQIKTAIKEIILPFFRGEKIKWETDKFDKPFGSQLKDLARMIKAKN